MFPYSRGSSARFSNRGSRYDHPGEAAPGANPECVGIPFVSAQCPYAYERIHHRKQPLPAVRREHAGSDEPLAATWGRQHRAALG